MSTLSAKKSSNPKTAAPKKTSAKSNPAPRRKAAPIAIVAKTPPQPVETSPKALAAHEPQLEGVTKQERMLTLLSRPEGASIEEMMQATDWQQHSVRGFLGIHPLCTPGKGRPFLKARYAAFAWGWCWSFQCQGNNSPMCFAG